MSYSYCYFPRGYGENIIEEKFSIAPHIHILESVIRFFRRKLQIIKFSQICFHLFRGKWQIPQLIKEPS
jgi:hypothetical protein